MILFFKKPLHYHMKYGIIVPGRRGFPQISPRAVKNHQIAGDTVLDRTKAVYCGIDNIASVAARISGASVGLVTGPTGVTRDMKRSIDVAAGLCRLTALFSPEHGIRGELQAGLGDDASRDRATGAEIIPLYGRSRVPSMDILSRLDFLLFDMQDAGARYYTYLSTLTDCMKAAAAAKTPVIVFDRPNPISLSRVEGSLLDERFSSFVGRYGVPTRYGLTIGEYAHYINGSRGLGCDLTVVPCEGLTRDMYYDDTGLCFVNPSPNINSTDCAVNYIATCLFEQTNVSEGRGTTTPFSVIGAPWIDSEALVAAMDGYGFEGAVLRPAFFTPVYGKYVGESCEGVQIHITDRNRYQPFELGLRLFDEIRSLFPQMKVNQGVDLLFGSDRLRLEYIGRRRIDSFLAGNAETLEKWSEEARPYRIY